MSLSSIPENKDRSKNKIIKHYSSNLFSGSMLIFMYINKFNKKNLTISLLKERFFSKRLVL